LRYVKSRLKESDREETYRIYVTKALQLFGNLNMSYLDIVHRNDQTGNEKSDEEVREKFKAGLNAQGGE